MIEAEKLKALTEITGAASHEMGQPLSGVMGCIEMVLTLTEEDDERHELVTDASGGTKRLVNLLKQIRSIRTYKTKPYLSGTHIVDYEKSSKKETE